MRALLPLALWSAGLLAANAQVIVVQPGDPIQPAIDQLAAEGGGTCQLEAGTWQMATPLKLRSNVTLAGRGDETRLELPDGANHPVITNAVEGIANVTIRDLKIDGRLETNEQTLGPEHHTDPALQNIGRRHTFGIIFAAFTAEMDSIRVERVTVTRCAMGIHIKGARDVMVTDCALFGNGIIQGFYHNLYLRRVTDGIVTGCVLTNSPTGNGLNVSYSTNLTALNSVALDNFFRGFRFADTVGVTNRFCQALRNGDYGIVLEREITPVVNFAVEGNRSEANGRNGIFVHYGSNGRVNNNVAVLNALQNIATFQATNVIVQNNLTELVAGVLEAERAEAEGVRASWEHPGYSGSGYVVFTNSSGASLAWPSLTAPVAGNYVVQFRYANGAPTEGALELSVNDVAGASALVFPPTEGWSNWAMVNVNVALEAGGNTVKLSTIGADAPVIDHLKFVLNTAPTISSMGNRQTNIITSANAGGADAFVRAGPYASSNYGSAPDLPIKGETAVNEFTRKTWLRFGLDALPPREITEATLRLSLAQSSATTAEFIYNVYGLTNGHSGENWDESAITWNNAPGNDTSSPAAASVTDAPLLGPFAVSGVRTAGNAYPFSTLALRDFLNSDTDRRVTLIVGRITPDPAADVFASKEHGTVAAPVLIVVTDTNYAARTIYENESTGLIPFVINDAETSAADLLLSAASSNETLVPTNNIVFGGSGSARTVTVTPSPAQSGSVLITVTVSDGVLSASSVLDLTVLPLPRPSLSIGVSVDETSWLLSWSSSFSNFVLQTATDLTPPIEWVTVTNPVVSGDGVLRVEWPVATEQSRFFRLAQPP